MGATLFQDPVPPQFDPSAQVKPGAIELHMTEPALLVHYEVGAVRPVAADALIRQHAGVAPGNDPQTRVTPAAPAALSSAATRLCRCRRSMRSRS
jgi:hypothetical protein